jgi:hypothetical protein
MAARARLPLRVHCPKSAVPWREAPSRASGAADRLSAVCPSCGQGLRLVDHGGLPELIVDRAIPPALRHSLVAR